MPIMQNDVGVIFKLSTGIDLTTATLLQIHITQPSGDDLVKTATVDGVASDGVIKFTNILTDFDEVGVYCANSYVEFGGGTTKLTGKSVNFSVEAPCSA